MLNRTWCIGLLLAGAASIVGCTSYRPRGVAEIEPEALVELWLGEPDTVVFMSTRSHSALTLPDVVVVQGRVASMNGDSVRLRVNRVTQASGETRVLGYYAIAAFGSDELARLKQGEMDTGKTVAGVALFLVGAFVLLMIVAAATTPEPEPEPKDSGKGDPTYGIW